MYRQPGPRHRRGARVEGIKRSCGAVAQGWAAPLGTNSRGTTLTHASRVAVGTWERKSSGNGVSVELLRSAAGNGPQKRWHGQGAATGGAWALLPALPGANGQDEKRVRET